MSELRQRLVQRSERFDLEPGALERMFAHGMRIQRRRRIAAGAVALAIGALGTLIVLSAFRGDRRVPVDHPSPTQVAIRSIPEGSYWTEPLTRAQLLASITDAGYSRREAKKYYFDALTIPFDRWIRQGLVIKGGFWFQTARNAAGNEEAGWGGNFAVIGPQKVRATDNVCTITYWFSLSGDSLELRVLRETGPRGACGRDLIPQIAIYDSAPFIRQP